MERRRLFALTTSLLAIVALAGAPAVQARKHHRHPRAAASRTKRCRNDKQCQGGTCNGAGQCCNTFAGQTACGTTCCDTLVEGQSCCGSSCADLRSDNSNCGGCGVVCAFDESCQNGVCTCTLGETKCGDRCVNTSSDNANCGSCGNACTGLSKNCLDGACVCPSGLTDCGDCVDTMNDPNNCGGCDVLCQYGADCVNGACQSPCPLCQVNENGTCVPRPCGPCEACSMTTGQCASTCSAGQSCCDDTCLDTTTDASNCGGCGTVCPAGQDCVGGACQAPRCAPPTLDCDGVYCCPEGQLCVHNDYTGAPLCCIAGFGRREDCLRLGTPLICCMPQ